MKTTDIPAEFEKMRSLDNTTDTGLRIAMIASRTVVYAGLQTAANLKGVYGTAAATDPEDVATSAMAAYEQILDLRDGKHFRFDW